MTRRLPQTLREALAALRTATALPPKPRDQLAQQRPTVKETPL